MNSQYVLNIFYPTITLLILTFIPIVYPLPIFIQMLTSSALIIHLGSVLSITLQTASYQQIKNCQRQNQNDRMDLNGWKRCKQIVQYPIVALFVLLSLYGAITFFDKLTISLLLDVGFIMTTSYYGFVWSKPFIKQLTVNFKTIWNLSLKLQNLLICITANLLNAIFWCSLTLLYTFTKHWLLNNFFAIGFAICGIKYGNLKSFKIIFPLLWCLFLYDFILVYYTNIMVTVAKQVDLPLLLKFPYFQGDSLKFSMLGLGDIVMPGLLLSLCLKYEVDCCIHSPIRPKKLTNFTLTLYYTTLSAYILSLTATYSSMYFFNHAQPALVFIVPICTLTVFGTSYFIKRSYSLLEYNSRMLALANSVI